MNIFWQGGIVVICYLLSLVIVDRLYIIQSMWGWVRGQVRAGIDYWRGQVSGGCGVGEQGGAFVDTEKAGSMDSCIVRKPVALHCGVETLPGNAKGRSASGAAIEVGDKSSNQSIFHGGVQRARRRLVVYAQSADGLQMKIALVSKFGADIKQTGQSVISIALAGA